MFRKDRDEFIPVFLIFFDFPLDITPLEEYYNINERKTGGNEDEIQLIKNHEKST